MICDKKHTRIEFEEEQCPLCVALGLLKAYKMVLSTAKTFVKKQDGEVKDD